MPEGLTDYYAYCNGESKTPFTERTKKIWDEAGEEALCIVLGTDEGNAKFDAAIHQRLGEDMANKPLILLGGHPCQAYSLVGRALNKGITDYLRDPLEFDHSISSASI